MFGFFKNYRFGELQKKEWLYAAMIFFCSYSGLLLFTSLATFSFLSVSIVPPILYLFRFLLCFYANLNQKLILKRFSYGEIIFAVITAILGVYLCRYTLSGDGDVHQFVVFFAFVVFSFSFKYSKNLISPFGFNVFFYGTTILLIVSQFTAVADAALFDNRESAVRLSANPYFNTILFGQISALLVILAVVKGKLGFVWTKYDAIPLVVGVLSIVRSGSRSPIIVVIAVVVLTLIASQGVVRSVAILAVGSIFVFWGSNVIFDLLMEINAGYVSRFIALVNDGNTSGRSEIYKNAYSLIMDNWAFGYGYFIHQGVGSGSYPHNFFLEALLILGVGPGMLLIALFLYAIYKALGMVYFGDKGAWIGVLYLHSIISGMFSGQLISSYVWLYLYFLLSVKNRGIDPNPNK